MACHRAGLAAASVKKHLAHTGAMLTALRVHRTTELARWTPGLIERYVSRKARRCPLSGRGIASCTRSFLRFLLQDGLIRRDLTPAVPRCARWRLAELPETLSADEVRRLVNAADVRTPLGLRNRAMLLCMSELGLRASDVAGLEFGGCNNLGWHKANGELPRPRIHDLRHSFACRRLLHWYRRGQNVHHLVAALSTYLGHGKVTDTYWYLTSTPQLLSIAGDRFEHFASLAGGREP